MAPAWSSGLSSDWKSYKAVLDATAMGSASTLVAPWLLSSLRRCDSSPLHPSQRPEAASHALVLMELLEQEGSMDGELQAAFARLYQRPALQRLLHLQRQPPRGHWNLQEPILERQTSLGPCFRIFADPMWQQARYSARSASLGRDTLDPVSMDLVSWTATATKHDKVLSRGRVGGYGDPKTRGGCLVPTFVGHDRASHAERAALLRLLIAVENAR